MELKDLIRGLIQESILIEEDKTSLIKKIKKMTPTQKEVAIKIFKDKPHLEKIVGDRKSPYFIDWNKLDTLTFDNFAPLLELGSMGAAFKKLKNNKDYVKVLDKDLENVPGLLGVFMPLNHNAANILAKKAGNNKAEWCIGYDGDDGYWYCYSYGINHPEYSGDGYESVFFIIITGSNKWAVQVQTNNNNNIKIWDANDKNHGDDNDVVPMVNVQKLVRKHSTLIDSVRKELDKRGESDSRLEELRDNEEIRYASQISIGDEAALSPYYFDLPTAMRESLEDVYVEVIDIDEGNDEVEVQYDAYLKFYRKDWGNLGIEKVEDYINDDDIEFLNENSMWFYVDGITPMYAIEDESTRLSDFTNEELIDDLESFLIQNKLPFDIDYIVKTFNIDIEDHLSLDDETRDEYINQLRDGMKYFIQSFSNKIRNYYKFKEKLGDLDKPFISVPQFYTVEEVTVGEEVEHIFGRKGTISYIDNVVVVMTYPQTSWIEAGKFLGEW
jgi:hypothetical protein